MNGRSNHAAHDRRGNRLHHIGADAGFPEDRGEAGENGNDGHQLGAKAFYRPFNHGFFDVRIGMNVALAQSPLQRFVEMHPRKIQTP